MFVTFSFLYLKDDWRKSNNIIYFLYYRTCLLAKQANGYLDKKWKSSPIINADFNGTLLYAICMAGIANQMHKFTCYFTL